LESLKDVWSKCKKSKYRTKENISKIHKTNNKMQKDLLTMETAVGDMSSTKRETWNKARA